MRLAVLCLALASCLPAACNRTPAPAAASRGDAAADNARMTLGDATLQASTVAIADLNAEVARRYGLDRSQDGVLLLVTLRDAAGNALAPGDLHLAATAAALGDPPHPLQLQSILVDGLTDYVGVFPAKPPATLQFRITAVRNGARADITTNADLQPR